MFLYFFLRDIFSFFIKLNGIFNFSSFLNLSKEVVTYFFSNLVWLNFGPGSKTSHRSICSVPYKTQLHQRVLRQFSKSSPLFLPTGYLAKFLILSHLPSVVQSAWPIFSRNFGCFSHSCLCLFLSLCNFLPLVCTVRLLKVYVQTALVLN